MTGLSKLVNDYHGLGLWILPLGHALVVRSDKNSGRLTRGAKTAEGFVTESISPSGATNRQDARFARLRRLKGEAQDVLSETGFKWPSRSETNSGNLFSAMSLATVELF